MAKNPEYKKLYQSEKQKLKDEMRLVKTGRRTEKKRIRQDCKQELKSLRTAKKELKQGYKHQQNLLEQYAGDAHACKRTGSLDPYELNDYLAYKPKSARPDMEIGWRRVDTAALLYPIVSSRGYTNVYRLCVTLREEVQRDLLQQAVDFVLPRFLPFKMRLCRGMFWYYFEQNYKRPPRVEKEKEYPCSYIEPLRNNDYLFRVTYFQRRINLEVFHVLTDGYGALDFLKELVYHYLRLAHPELAAHCPHALSSDLSLNMDDGFADNYEKKKLHPYHGDRAFLLKGELLPEGKLGVITGYMPLHEVKQAAKRYGLTVNEFIVSAVNWAVYQEYRNKMKFDRAIVTCVPVNMRPYYHSITTSNFFVNTAAKFMPAHTRHTFEDVAAQIAQSLRSQITKEHLADILSIHVSAQNHIVSRSIPLFLKRPALRNIHKFSALFTSLTVSNMGRAEFRSDYMPYIDTMNVVLARSKRQNLKTALISVEDRLTVTISSVLRRTQIQEYFYRFLVSEGIHVRIESNGVYN